MKRREMAEVFRLDKEIKMRQKQLDELRMSSQIKATRTDGIMARRSGECTSKVEEYAIKIIEHTETVNAFKMELENKKMEIDRWIMTLDDSYLRQILYYRYYKMMPWKKIAFLLSTTEESVKQYFIRHTEK